jgi:2-polyprenyl-3-methyl-5-hydroxy-6-metoxy-1,4-benzoquinol methylase
MYFAPRERLTRLRVVALWKTKLGVDSMSAVQEARLPEPPLLSQIDISGHVRRIVQTVCDLAPKPLSQCRILDLACAHGQYALEFARRGATTLGIEGRREWIDHALASKAALQITSAEFVQDDVRNLSVEKYGAFDIVLCLGILYHLNAPDNFELLARVSECCTGVAIITTQIATHQTPRAVQWRGATYWGAPYLEHEPDSSAEARTKALGASLNEEFSFWLTRSSLLNAIRHVGFTSAYEALNPLGSMYVDGALKLHADVVTLVAMGGRTGVRDIIGRVMADEPDDWPEDPSQYYLQRPWSPPRQVEP